MKGADLCREFYLQCVAPIIDEHFPDLDYGAALLGPGSEVLGFDDETSTDHNFGPRCLLFLRDGDEHKGDSIVDILSLKLPRTFLGRPVGFGPPLADDPGSRLPEVLDHGPVNHRVEVFTLKTFLGSHMDLKSVDDLEPEDWLALSQQKLLSVAKGPVFRPSPEIESLQTKLQYFPDDVWLFIMASLWAQIGQEEHLMPRAGHAGDELGSRLICGRLANCAMKLLFAMDRQYAPYPKWFGTAFRQLPGGPELGSLLESTLAEPRWQGRTERMADVYSWLACRHNNLKLTDPIPTDTSFFWNRPFKVIWGEKTALALADKIANPRLQRIARQAMIGSIDVFTDNTELIEKMPRRFVKALYNDSC